MVSPLSKTTTFEPDDIPLNVFISLLLRRQTATNKTVQPSLRRLLFDMVSQPRKPADLRRYLLKDSQTNGS